MEIKIVTLEESILHEKVLLRFDCLWLLWCMHAEVMNKLEIWDDDVDDDEVMEWVGN